MAKSITYTYIINDKMSKVFNRMSKANVKFSSGIKKSEKSLDKFGRSLSKISQKSMSAHTAIAGIGSGMVIKKSIDDALEFNKALNLTKAVTGATADQMAAMKKQAFELGGVTAFSSIQVAKAMAELGKKGLEVNEIMLAMPGTMNLAAAGQISLSEAANYTIGIVNQFGLELTDAARVADILAVASTNSTTSVDRIAAAMVNVGLQANLAGLSIEDTTAALMSMSDKMLDGESAGTMLMNALLTLQKLPTKTADGFDALGISIDEFRDPITGMMTDFWGLIDAMRLADITGVDLGEMFDIRAMKAMSILVSTSSEDIDEYRRVVDEAAGASQELADILLEGTVGSLIRFESAMKNLSVALGEFLGSTLAPGLEVISAFFSKVATGNPFLLELIGITLLLTAGFSAVVIPFAILTATTAHAIKGFRVLIGGIGKVVKLMGLLTKASWIQVVAKKALAAATKIQIVAQKALNLVMGKSPLGIALKILGLLIPLVILLAKNFDKVKEIAKMVGETFIDLGKLILSYILAPIKMLFKLLSRLPGKAGEAFASIEGKIPGLKESFDDLITIETPKTQAEAANMMAAPPTSMAPGPGTVPTATATATANVSVYKSEGVDVVPYESSGDLGYNLKEVG